MRLHVKEEEGLMSPAGTITIEESTGTSFIEESREGMIFRDSCEDRAKS